MSSVYKIITKVLATRLNEVLSDTISENQSAFILGRQILDVALIANEVVENIRSQGNLGLVFKLDLRKLMIKFVGVFWTKFWTRKGLGRDGEIGFQDVCPLLLLQLLLMINLDSGLKVKEV